MIKIRNILFVFLVVLSSCNVSINRKEIKVQRMDRDLFECTPEHLKDSVPLFYQKYGTFFHIFTENIINIGDSSNPSFSEYLTNFVTNYGVYNSYQTAKVLYPDLKDLEAKLGYAFGLYATQFSGEKPPRFYAYISGYLQGIAALDSIVGIGLDMYLGRDFEGYKVMWPDKKYKRYNLHKNKIPTDCIQYWAMSKYPFASQQNHVLANMLYQGKIMYFNKQLMPKEHDTLIYGYSPEQLKWCANNEQQMWTYLVEHKMLFNTDYITINKFVSEGPFTHFFTNESPARAVVWIGSRIVSDYMNHNKKVTLKELMNENDYQKILRLSKYKP